MLRDKMIQIMSAHGRPFFQAAFDREIRCDKCEHWGSPDVVTGKGTCETVPSDDYIWTAPDFFCALWEEKK